MKPETTLKELFKSSFSFDHSGFSRLYLDDKKNFLIEFLYKDCNIEEKILEDIEKFIAAALNEKWERDFGGPLRWIIDEDDVCERTEISCPYCKTEYVFDVDMCDLNCYNYCPHCGVKLGPPEEVK